ncbi:MAG TPA: hypothetical protein VG326_01745 [Tepidisphaeraceae bacterium]|jgi:hypothetical protein|nr:hypothetical protein [Tepidisphaeraceae bacterium]
MSLRIALVLLTFSLVSTFATGTFAAPQPPRPPSPAVVATKALAEARIKLNKVKGEVDVIRKRIAVNYEAKPDWKAAKETLDAAKAEYEAASKRVRLALENDPAYKEQIAKRAKAQATVDAGAKREVASADDNAAKLTDDDVNKAQQDRIDSAIAMKKMERESGENDSKFVAARQKEKEAQAAWDALQSQLDDAMKLDPAYPPVKIELDQAEAAVKQAQEQYNAATKSQVHPPRR